MMVSINFFGIQRTVTKTDSISMPVTGDMRIADALEYVRNLYPELHLREGAVIAVVNQELASPDRLLAANDSISFLPHIGGG